MQSAAAVTAASVLRAGVSADTIYMKDLEKCDISRYRMIIFTNAVLLSREQREKIKSLTRGKQVVWLETPGYCDGESLSLSHTEDLLGMKLKTVIIEQEADTLQQEKEKEIMSV